MKLIFESVSNQCFEFEVSCYLEAVGKCSRCVQKLEQRCSYFVFRLYAVCLKTSVISQNRIDVRCHKQGATSIYVKMLTFFTLAEVHRRNIKL